MKRIGSDRSVVPQNGGAPLVSPGGGSTSPVGAPGAAVVPPASAAGAAVVPPSASGATLVPQAARTAATIPPRVVTLPEGWPPTFDLGRAAEGVTALLAAQGKPDAGIASSVVFTDADLTLFEAPALPTYLVHAKTGALLLDPDTQTPIRLGLGATRDAKADLAALGKSRPDLDLSAYVMDNREFESVANILSAQPIAPTVEALQKSGKNSRQFVVTARGSTDAVCSGLSSYLDRQAVPMDGVFMIYNPAHTAQLGIDGSARGQGRRKALTMAAVLHRYDPAMATVRHVRFIDDNDENLRAAMALLPKLFPNVRFEFVDVIHEGDGHYRHHLVARSSKSGGLADMRGRALSDQDIEKYASTDAPLPPAAPPIGFWKAEEKFGELANFAAFPVQIGGHTWPTTEHYFQAQKFAGTPHEAQIRGASTPALAAAMGRDKQRPLRADWETVKEDIMRAALAAKFAQHADLRALLLSTGTAQLTEASPKDGYWGTGADGKGKNRLGELLMELRANLRSEAASS